MSRIKAVFARIAGENKKALIPYVTAGDPTAAITVPLMHTLVKAGADVIELGMPFSDPMAEGPVIQRACERALNNGVGLLNVLSYVNEFRKTDTATPVVLMGYANPIEHMGLETFAGRAKAAGVDGVLIVDYPPEEGAQALKVFDAAEIDSIYLLSPTSSEARIKLVAKAARGYVYYVSLKGVTGAANIDTESLAPVIKRIKAETTLPVGVGFGIRDGATAKLVANVADAVVIGSRIIQEMESSTSENLLANVEKLVGDIRRAMDT